MNSSNNARDGRLRDGAKRGRFGTGSWPLFLAGVLLTACNGGTGLGDGPFNPGVGGFSPLEISPTVGFNATGLPGGPFTPSSQAYVLSNVGSNPINWAASSTQSWLDLSQTSGVLAPGDQATVNATIDDAVASGLSTGAYSAEVSIVDQTNGNTHLMSVGLIVLSESGTALASTLNQFGITWTFDQEYEVGRFVNGDWWVVGPVGITGISPGSANVFGRTQNGSMVNPHASNRTQGYDSTTYGQFADPGDYDPALNVALTVSGGNTLVLQPHTSLVSTISRPEASVKPQIDTAAILTVLDAPPPLGSFRPPYCGNDKTIRYNVAQLDYTLLASLPQVSSTPSLGAVEAMFERPWLEHVEDWLNGYIHPRTSMPHYGRDISDVVSTGALMLHLDFTQAQKETLMIRYVQLGIDLYGIVENGGGNNWPDNGGHGSGRKWPILFAGLVLGDPAMSGIGQDPWVFGEDGQTFFIEETSPGVYNFGYGGYGPQHLGMAEWAPHHARNPEHDDVDWFANAYRQCCTANVWWGQVLAAHIMGAQPLWNNDALFEYQDRYYIVSPQQGITDWKYFNNGFHREMWETYRSNF